ncbi:hypothetical protein JCM16303_002386 [Sporobolomyces ruberrimus]
MPFVKLPNERDVEIYFEFYEPFDPERPTALFLPPAISCSALILQQVFPRLPEVTKAFNCLSLDLRGHGRSKTPLINGIDCFVFASDIAFVLNDLGIFSVHLVANSYVSGPTAFAFTILFPSAVCSLTILGTAPLDSMPSQLPALMELLEGWLQKDDEEALFDSMNAILDLAFTASSREGDVDLRDWLANAWFRRIAPHHALRCFVQAAPVLMDPKITKEELAAIKCPVLFVQGTDDTMQGIPVAYDLLEKLTGTEDATMEIVEGGPSYLGIENLEDVAPILSSFLLSHKPLTSSSPPSSIPFPSPPSSTTPSSSSSFLDSITSLSYSRFSHSEPLVQQLWAIANELEGKCFVTFADREPEMWEPNGLLFSQRNRNERSQHTSRRGSVPRLIKRGNPTMTTVVSFESDPLSYPTPLTPRLHYSSESDGFEEEEDSESSGARGWNGGNRKNENRGGYETITSTPTVQFRMDTWKWESETRLIDPTNDKRDQGVVSPFIKEETGLITQPIPWRF